MCDPDGTFLKTDAGWLPVTLQLCTGYDTEAVQLDERERPTGYRPQARRDAVSSFAGMWLKNIDEQQGGLARIRQTMTT